MNFILKAKALLQLH